MTIRTPGQLDRFLSRSLSWRKKELTALKFAVDTAPQAEQEVLLRAAATLLYSHWEGFVKEAATAYLQLVSKQNLTLSELKSTFVAVSVGTAMVNCGRSKKISARRQLVDRIRAAPSVAANMAWRGVARTRSNLKAAVLREIINTLDLDYAPFELKAKPVIDRLVGA
ncbi:MAG TPA: MAE_28990/MAE_18760 family HEPN-like nuclease, partial [Pirellulales bacterium]|nr:MAE_28990/MAE_18760 family HEPN-like nuclease [Pirellulales bacterium]